MNWSNNNRLQEIIDEDDTPPKSVIIKVPTIDALSRLYQAGQDSEENSDATAGFEATVRMMHNDECAVYKLLDGEDAVPMPRCHMAIPSVQDGDRGLLMLEDMSEKGVGMRSFADFLNLSQTYELTDALASLHAWSVRTNIPWRDRLPILSERVDIYRTFTQMTPMLAAKVKTQMSDRFGDLSVERVVSIVNVDSYLRMFDIQMTPRTKLPVVLVHGDVHSMNVMFTKRIPDGRAGNKLVALFDYQLSHRGYGTEDLARLFAMGTSSEIRRQSGDAILMRYVEMFNAKVCDQNKRITFDDVKEAFDEMFTLVAIWISMTAAIAEDFLKKSLDKLEDEEERKDIIDQYISNNALLYKDAAKMLGW